VHEWSLADEAVRFSVLLAKYQGWVAGFLEAIPADEKIRSDFSGRQRREVASASNSWSNDKNRHCQSDKIRRFDRSRISGARLHAVEAVPL
jgi:hypothetical protein